MPLQLTEEETRAWLALLRAPGVGAATIRKLLGQYGSVAAALDAARRNRAEISDTQLIDADLRWLEAAERHLLVCNGADFPELLRDISSAPAALFVSGDPASLWAPQIAIVGARRATREGLANAHAFAGTLVRAGNVITSGLAEGVDGAAHAGALEAGGKTIAVLGTGPDVIYPRRHKKLAERIVEHGALVSEFSPGTLAKPEFFPRRNRIIAGLSLGTLVIEAGVSSGSLITARFAADQGREVFAVPGSIHNPLARGCHQLLREGARLVETAEEMLEELHGLGGVLADGLRRRLDCPMAAPPATSSARATDPEYARLLAALDPAPAALDELVAHTGFSAAALSSMLLVLELDGAVAAENGRYSRRTF